jgi:class 3 adenylate cyclase
MVFSLQKRFFLFLLVPVILVLVLTYTAMFMYTRAHLLDQWRGATKLRLEKTAHLIQMRLDAKRDLIQLIAAAEEMADPLPTQAYIARKLAQQQGVRMVEIQPVGGPAGWFGGAYVFKDSGARWWVPGSMRFPGLVDEPTTAPRNRGESNAHSHGFGFGKPPRKSGPAAYAPPEVSLDRGSNLLAIVKPFGGDEETFRKRVVVQVAFDSFMEGILEVGQWQASYACLVRADGAYLAHTSPERHGETRMCDSRDPLETRVLNEMKDKAFGAILGPGHPPEKIAAFYRVPTTDWYLVLYSQGREVLDPLVRFRFGFALAALAAVIFIGFLIRWSTRPVAHAVREISEAAQKVEDGDFSPRVSEGGSDEIGQLKSRFNQMIERLKERELIEQTFGRYVDKKIAKELLSRPEALKLGGEKHVVSIMMADVRDFTQMADRLPPEAVIRIINRFFGAMIPIIDKRRGIVVDFFGDSILVFFDGLGPDTSVRAADAVTCAVEMQLALSDLSARNERDNLPALHMGIGVHTGEVIVGNIGSETRAKYGVVGSAVNETHRIQAEAGGGTVLISGRTREVLGTRVTVGAGTQVTLKGLDGVRELFPVEAIDGKSHRSG